MGNKQSKSRKTISLDKLDEYLVNGYIRDIQRIIYNNKIFPLSIIKICIKYYTTSTLRNHVLYIEENEGDPRYDDSLQIAKIYISKLHTDIKYKCNITPIGRQYLFIMEIILNYHNKYCHVIQYQKNYLLQYQK